MPRKTRDDFHDDFGYEMYLDSLYDALNNLAFELYNTKRIPSVTSTIRLFESHAAACRILDGDDVPVVNNSTHKIGE